MIGFKSYHVLRVLTTGKQWILSNNHTIHLFHCGNILNKHTYSNNCWAILSPVKYNEQRNDVYEKC